MESFNWNAWKKIKPERWAELEASVKNAEKKAMAEIGNTPEQISQWRLIKNSSLSKNDAESKTFEKFKSNELTRKAFDLMNSWEPDRIGGQCFGYFIYGTVGTGKTHLTKALLIKWAKAGRKCKFTSLISLMDQIKDSMDGGSVLETIQSYSDYDILALDDLGAERATPFSNEKFLSILETRLCTGRPTFITSNLTGEDLKDRYDVRILDRFREMFIFLNLSLKSYREKIYTDRSK